MCSSHGRAIAEEMKAMTLVEDWELTLGDYLYMAMKTSRKKILEEDTGQLCTKAVMISAPNGNNYDSKLVVKMNFNIGRDLLAKCYPSDSRSNFKFIMSTTTFHPLSKVASIVVSLEFCWVIPLIPTLIRPLPFFQDMCLL
jgi:hypothetical protein